MLDKCYALHDENKTQSKDGSKSLEIRRRSNIKLFRSKWNDLLKMVYLKSQYQKDLNGCLKVGIVVTENNSNTAYGDYFTGLELAKALEDIGYLVELIPMKSKKRWHDPYNVDKFDVIINLLHNYSIDKIYKEKPHLIKICWARNWSENGYQIITLKPTILDLLHQ